MKMFATIARKHNGNPIVARDEFRKGEFVWVLPCGCAVKDGARKCPVGHKPDNTVMVTGTHGGCDYVKGIVE